MADGGGRYEFTAFLENVKQLHAALKAIGFQESAAFSATEQGLKVTVEQSKCVQASAYVPAENFWEYALKAQDGCVEFKLSLSVLCECLNIFGAGDETTLKMYYKGAGGPLILMLENKSKDVTSNDDFVTDCEIKTQEADELMYFKADDVTESVTLVVKGAQFMNVICDLEKTSETVEFQFSPDHPHISITTLGSQDRSSIEIPKSSDMIHTFQCSNKISFKYTFSHIRLTLKALALASKVALKINSRGLLIVQHMIEREEQKQMFIEFYITPLVDDDDDDD